MREAPDRKTTSRKVKPNEFDIPERLKNGMGVYDDKKAEDVQIRFTAKIAPYILERTWHPTQTVTKHADGGITLGLRVAHTPELEGFIVRWAGNVEVMGPVGVRKRIREMGAALVAAHREVEMVSEAQLAISR